jgi:hypothetical protein
VTVVGERYGTRKSLSSRLLVWFGAIILVGLIVWLGWAIWFNGHPKVHSQQNSVAFAPSHATITVDIEPAAGIPLRSVSCDYRVEDKSYNYVAEGKYVPTVVGSQTFTVRTLREGVYVDWVGCTAPGQKDPR